MAAPHVTGVMALLLAEKNYTPSELINKIKDTATTSLSSKSKVSGIVDKISRLIGAEYEDTTDAVKLLYMGWISSSFANSDFSLSSSTSTMHLPMAYIIQPLLSLLLFSGFFILC
jgi:subtilisin family serine protease